MNKLLIVARSWYFISKETRNKEIKKMKKKGWSTKREHKHWNIFLLSNDKDAKEFNNFLYLEISNCKVP